MEGSPSLSPQREQYNDLLKLTAKNKISYWNELLDVHMHIFEKAKAWHVLNCITYEYYLHVLFSLLILDGSFIQPFQLKSFLHFLLLSSHSSSYSNLNSILLCSRREIASSFSYYVHTYSRQDVPLESDCKCASHFVK